MKITALNKKQLILCCLCKVIYLNCLLERYFEILETDTTMQLLAHHMHRDISYFQL